MIQGGPCLPMLLLAAGLGAGATLALKREPRLRRRTIDEVADFLYDPDQQRFLVSLDPDEDDLWQRQGDRRFQRVRVDRFRECLGLMLRDVRVLYEWADTERVDNQHYDLGYSPSLVKAIDRLVESSRLYLKVGRAVQRRLNLAAFSRFEILRLMPVPQLARYTTVDGFSLLEGYKAVGTAGEALALAAHGEVEPIVRQIRTCFWTA